MLFVVNDCSELAKFTTTGLVENIRSAMHGQFCWHRVSRARDFHSESIADLNRGCSIPTNVRPFVMKLVRCATGIRRFSLVVFIFSLSAPVSSQSLEQDCPSLPPFYQVFCGNPDNARECVLELWLCDGKEDCSTGLDESTTTCFGGDPCVNVPCQNGGLCHGFPAVEHVSVAYFTCACPPGVEGVLCEISLQSSSMQPPVSSSPLTQRSTLSTSELPPSTVYSSTSTSTTTTQWPVTTSVQTTRATEQSLTTYRVTGQQSTQTHTNKPGNSYTQNVTFSGVTSTVGTTNTATPSTLPTPNPYSCMPNPCLNGVCTPLRDGFHCSCRPGFAGRLCDTGSDPCASEPCINGGRCNNQGNNYVCACTVGFTGRQCDVEENECASLPCLNQGICTDGRGQFSCMCAPGYTGRRCEFDVDECASSPCYLAEGGRCVDQVNGYRCECPPSRAGSKCERRQLCTDGDPCQNDGLCYPTADPTQPRCYCSEGLTGRFCETNIDDCVGISCGPHGTCVDAIGGYQCSCIPGFEGRRCERELDPCEPNPCRNNGYCCRRGKTWCSTNLRPDYFECYCTDGFTGSRCETRGNPCTPDPCQNGGWCTEKGGRYDCTCPLTYTGIHCEIAVPCASQPCINNGLCRDERQGKYSCQCGADHYGPFCEFDVPCLSQPCLNDGRCVNDQDRFSCICPDTHRGAICEEFIPCSSGPCHNNATCVNTGTTFQCRCGPAYSGALCEFFLACSSEPCLNGGQCIQNVATGTYQCECPADHAGVNCETFLPCVSDPCVNGGTCVATGDFFSCRCTEAFGGPTCASFLACSSNPCLNGGSCVNVGSTFRCDCPPTHGGPNCESFIACSSNPCLNNGRCLVAGVGYVCECTSAYSGLLCQVFRQCSISPCENGGTCSDLPDGQFRCVCPATYTGPTCDLPAACDPNPCFSGATCTSAPGGQPYLCVCPPLYRGTRCEIFDPCLSSPCRNSVACRAHMSSFVCDCLAGFTGQTCESRLACAELPCLNGGRCVDLPDGEYACNCSNTFGGRNCETYIPCGSNPCQNGGSCSSSGGIISCECPPNYAGSLCEMAEACAFEPCLRGSCVNTAGPEQYVCQCEAGFTGRRCEALLQCDTTICQRGTCQQEGSYFICICEPNYSGVGCESRLSPCDRSPCLNGGSCRTPTSDTFTCTCPAGFTGSQCEIYVLPCDSDPCLQNGTCTDLENSAFFCSCVKPFTGVQCEFIEGACDSGPCQNGGRCLEDRTIGFECICPPPYRGSLCLEEVRSCVPNPCQAGGTCMQDTVGVFCRCPPSAEGLFCQLRRGLCTPNPCFNGGICWQFDGRTLCDCSSGFQGPTCLQSVVGCQPSPCNDGYCVEDQRGEFQCECPPNFIGQRCEIPNPCYSQPCRNGGSCVTDVVGGFSCYCASGFTGARCDTPLVACSSQPCFNGGTCRDFGSTSTFVCFCGPGFTGSRCQVDVDDCVGNSLCENGATCIDLPNNFRCDCAVGFSGVYCTTRDNCATGPCRNGAQCLNVASAQYGTDYTCRCTTGYVGATCDQRDFCRSAPCLNGGTCVNEPLTFRCICTLEYVGQTCRERARGCQDVTCSDKGQCVPVGVSGFRCECRQGYTGDRCQQSPCVTRPCQNQGTCELTEDGHVCTCISPWGGRSCEIRLSNLVPQFDGTSSYLRFPPPDMVATATTISLQIYSSASNGLLLYSSQPSTRRDGDFLLLALRDSRFIAQINLGSGVLTVDGPPVQQRRWQTLHLVRDGRSVALSVGTDSPRVGVSGEAVVLAETPGGNSGLTLGGALDVGGTSDPDNLPLLAAVAQSFLGCISEIRVGGARSTLLSLMDIAQSRNITPCTSSPCQPSPCLNGATCRLVGETEVTCLCPLGFTGERCQQVLANLSEPSFAGDGYLATPAMFTTETRRPSITLSIRPTALSGLVLFNYEFNDFVAISLEEGIVVLTFDLGSGPGLVRTTRPVSMRRWHRLRITLMGREGQLQLDDDPQVVGAATGGSQDRGVGEITFLGGVPHTVYVPPAVPVADGFRGCIKEVTVQGRPLLWSSTLGGAGVSECVYPVCESHRCAAGATCLASQTSPDGYRCLCPPGSSGPLCQFDVCEALERGDQCQNGALCVVAQDGSPDCHCTLSFTGPTCTEDLQFTVAAFRQVSFLAYPASVFIGTEFLGVDLVFRTTRQDSLLLWAGDITSEFFMLGVRGGVFDLRLNVGDGNLVLATNFLAVSLGQWYQVAVQQSGRRVTLDVTDSQGQATQFVGQMPGSDLQLSLNTPLLFLGGVPDSVSSVTSGLYTAGLDGCVIQLRTAQMASSWRSISLQQVAVDGRAISRCVV